MGTCEDGECPLQLGFLERTNRGRVATPLAYRHLGRPWVDKAQTHADQTRFSGF